MKLPWFWVWGECSGKLCPCQYLSDDGKGGGEEGGGGRGGACSFPGLLELTGDEANQDSHDPRHSHPGISESCLASPFLPQHSFGLYILPILPANISRIWLLFAILVAALLQPLTLQPCQLRKTPNWHLFSWLHLLCFLPHCHQSSGSRGSPR